jgi:hypothetical protein
MVGKGVLTVAGGGTESGTWRQSSVSSIGRGAIRGALQVVTVLWT